MQKFVGMAIFGSILVSPVKGVIDVATMTDNTMVVVDKSFTPAAPYNDEYCKKLQKTTTGQWMGKDDDDDDDDDEETEYKIHFNGFEQHHLISLYELNNYLKIDVQAMIGNQKEHIAGIKEILDNQRLDNQQAEKKKQEEETKAQKKKQASSKRQSKCLLRQTVVGVASKGKQKHLKQELYSKELIDIKRELTEDSNTIEECYGVWRPYLTTLQYYKEWTVEFVGQIVMIIQSYAKYKGQDPLTVGIITGFSTFFAGLLVLIWIQAEQDAESGKYGSDKRSCGGWFCIGFKNLWTNHKTLLGYLLLTSIAQAFIEVFQESMMNTVAGNANGKELKDVAQLIFKIVFTLVTLTTFKWCLAPEKGEQSLYTKDKSVLPWCTNCCDCLNEWGCYFCNNDKCCPNYCPVTESGQTKCCHCDCCQDPLNNSTYGDLCGKCTCGLYDGTCFSCCEGLKECKLFTGRNCQKWSDYAQNIVWMPFVLLSNVCCQILNCGYYQYNWSNPCALTTDTRDEHMKENLVDYISYWDKNIDKDSPQAQEAEKKKKLRQLGQQRQAMIKHAGEKLADQNLVQEKLNDNNQNVVSTLNGTIKKLQDFYKKHVSGHDDAQREKDWESLQEVIYATYGSGNDDKTAREIISQQEGDEENPFWRQELAQTAGRVD